jgi:putative tricarboxylic transport membrane protein
MRAHSSRRRLIGELITAAAFLALAGLVYQQTSTAFVEAGAASGGAMMNAAMYPDWLADGLIVLALLQIGLTLRGGFPGPEEAAPRPDHEPGVDAVIERAANRRKGLICLGLFVLYLFVLKTVGYHLATPVLLGAMFFVLGIRNPLAAAAWGIGVSLAMSALFEVGLDVILPVGRFGIGF